MQLSIAQKDFIKFVLSDFLQFSTTPELLQQEVISLKTAITTPVEKTHPFYILGNCVQDPCSRFQGLENQQEGIEITIGIVQTYIIELITQAITEAALNAQINMADLGWHCSELITQCVTEENLLEPFESEANTDEPEAPWEVTQEPGAIFEYQVETTLDMVELEPIEEGGECSLIPLYSSQISVKTYLAPDKNSLSISTLTMPALDGEEINVLTTLMILAPIEARKMALISALHFLLDLKILSLESFNIYINSEQEVNFTASEIKAITTRFYFDMLRQNKLSINELSNITEEQSNILIHPHICGLIEKNIIDIETAKSLSPEKFQLLCVSVYYALLKKYKIAWSQITLIDNNQAKLLTHPTIVNLIKLEKLPFYLATKLPLYAKSLFSNPNYITFFMRNQPDWTVFLIFNEAHFKLLLNKSFVRACTLRKVSFSELASLSDTVITLLTEHPRLACWYCSGILSQHDIRVPRNGNLLTLYSTTLSERINRIRMRIPFSIEDNVDTTDIILSEIPIISKEAGLSEQVFVSRIICNITVLIQKELKQFVSCFPFIYDPFLELASRKVNSLDAFDCAKFLTDALDKAKMVNNFEIDKITFFRPAKRKKLFLIDGDLKDFCRKLILLEPLREQANQLLSILSLHSSEESSLRGVFFTTKQSRSD